MASDFRSSVVALANQFVALPPDDQTRLDFVDRVERLLRNPKLTVAELRIGLHMMAVEALTACSADHGATLRDRLLTHLYAAELLGVGPEINDVTRLNEAHAFLKLDAASPSATSSDRAVARAVRAFDDLLHSLNAILRSNFKAVNNRDKNLPV